MGSPFVGEAVRTCDRALGFAASPVKWVTLA
jgi:hypothetical protein